jgi:hypothetical protein
MQSSAMLLTGSTDGPHPFPSSFEQQAFQADLRSSVGWRLQFASRPWSEDKDMRITIRVMIGTVCGSLAGRGKRC